MCEGSTSLIKYGSIAPLVALAETGQGSPAIYGQRDVCQPIKGRPRMHVASCLIDGNGNKDEFAEFHCTGGHVEIRASKMAIIPMSEYNRLKK